MERMGNDMEEYEDLEVISLLMRQVEREKAEQEEAKPIEPENQIQEGFLFLKGEKIFFREVSLLENQLTMRIPLQWEGLSEEQKKLKYPWEGRPDVILSNARVSMNLTLTQREVKMREERTEKVKNTTEFILKKMHPGSEEMESEVLEVEGKTIAYFELMTQAMESRVYNLMFLFSLRERETIGTFNCLESDSYDWKALFFQMLESIHFCKEELPEGEEKKGKDSNHQEQNEEGVKWSY